MAQGKTEKALFLKLKNFISYWKIPLNSTFNLAVIFERWVLITSVAFSYMTQFWFIFEDTESHCFVVFCNSRTNVFSQHINCKYNIFVFCQHMKLLLYYNLVSQLFLEAYCNVSIFLSRSKLSFNPRGFPKSFKSFPFEGLAQDTSWK